MDRAIAKVAYWLACGSPLCLLWMVVTFPDNGRHPSAIVNGVCIVLALSSPVGIALGFLLLALPASRHHERLRNPHATAAMVVGICAGLITALIFPLFTQSHGGSRRSCNSNVKMLGIAMQMYAQDYDDTLPRAARWNDLTMPYVKNAAVYRCSEEKDEKLPSYGMNGALSQQILASLGDPTHTVQLIDTKPGVNNVVGLSDYPFTDRHRTYVVIGFADGHVKSVPTDDVLKLDWTAKARTVPKESSVRRNRSHR